MDIEVVKNPIKSDDNNRSLFLFVRRNNGRYVLFMIDVIRLFGEKIAKEPLSPLVFFNRHVLPSCPCAFAFIEPNFYVVGEERHEVFTFNKYSVCNLKNHPCERRRGNEFLNPVNSPMLGKKSDPLAFGFNGNLYVISKRSSRPAPKQYSFEFYSTSTHTWTDLYPKTIWLSSIKTHVIHENTVYFCMDNHTIMSFNLRISKWSTVYDPYGVIYIHKRFHPRYTISHPTPTFDSNIQVFGNTVFGGVLRPGSSQHFDIFASQNLMPFEKFFLRPTLAPSKVFCNALDTDNPPLSPSKCIVNVDGIMCVVSYGNLPSRGLSNHAVLNFFDVSNDLHQPLSSSSGGTTLAQVPFGGFLFDAMEEDGQDVNYFKADFISQTQLPINTRRKSTHGTLCSCLLV